jgi:DNA-binding HxlR family transcriptional regulator
MKYYTIPNKTFAENLELYEILFDVLAVAHSANWLNRENIQQKMLADRLEELADRASGLIDKAEGRES